MWHKELDHKKETDKCRFRVASFCTGVGLDIGCRDSKINTKALALGETDICDVTINLHANDALAFVGENYYDYIYSSHFLEEFTATQAALVEWWSKLKPGGHLVLYCGDPDYSPKVGTKNCRREKVTDLYWEDVWKILDGFGNAEKISASRHDEFAEYSWQLVVKKKFVIAKKPLERITPSRDWGRVVYPRKKVTDKEVLVIRYGAFGDMIWATPILRELKRQGYYVVLNTMEMPAQVVRNNPNVDEFIIQEDSSIPNEDCEKYWNYIGQGFEKVVNLCGVVEDKLLRVEKRAGYNWSHEKRHERCNKNYIDTLMAEAGFPELKGELPELFFTPEEELAAKIYMESLKDKFVILWSLSGSAFHKTYPWSEDVCTALNDIKSDIEIITVGDEMCRILEWQLPNTQCKSGHFTIRQSMLMAKYVDLVVGPETAITNAASCYDTPKVVLLSHSSRENLTKYWKNCFPLIPDACPCYPCHQLHLTQSCPKGRVKGISAMCAEHISGSKVMAAISIRYDEWQAKKPDKKWVGFTTCYDELSNRRAKRVQASFKYYHPDIPFFIYDIKDEEKILGKIMDPGPYPAGVSWRPRLCEKLLKEYDGVMYFDDDTIIAARLDEFLKGDFDVAATLNVKGRTRDALYNDGVFALTDKAFAQCWANNVYDDKTGYANDQYVFNFLTNTNLYSVKVVDEKDVYYNERSREFWDKITIADGKLFCNNRHLKVLHWAGGFKVVGDKLSCAGFSEPLRYFLDSISGTTDFTDIKGEETWWPKQDNKPFTLNARGLDITCRAAVYLAPCSDYDVVNEVVIRDEYRIGQLKRFLNPKVILDLGGHIGTFGMMAKRAWPDAMLIVVEASEESCKFYRRNMINNNFKNWHILNYGLSYDPSATILIEDFTASGGGMLTNQAGAEQIFRESSGTRTMGQATVPTITVEEIIARFKLESIDLAKWDIEGSELPNWEHMTPDAAKKFKYMIGEFHIPKVDGGIDWKSSAVKRAEFWEIAKDRFPHLTFDSYAPLADIKVDTGEYCRSGIGLFEAVPKRNGEEGFLC